MLLPREIYRLHEKNTKSTHMEGGGGGGCTHIGKEGERAGEGEQPHTERRITLLGKPQPFAASRWPGVECDYVEI